MTTPAQAEAATFRVWVAVDPNGKVTSASVESYMTEEEFRRDFVGPNHVVLLVPGPIVLGSQVKTQHLTAALRLLAQQPAVVSAEAHREGFNVNGYIWVRLTRAGMDLVLSAGAGHSFQFNPQTGFYTVQLWEWMALTGPHTHLSMSEVFSVDNEIYFSEPALAAAEAQP